MNALNIEENEINEAKEQTETFSLQDLPQLQVSKSNRINSIKLDPPQPAVKHLEVYDIGLISNTATASLFSSILYEGIISFTIRQKAHCGASSCGGIT